ncbi:MAG: MEDS domain-containing protein [Actinomycetota bacterium]|nr:MEDS domain-containing protein [Actinomycetota bacterium]
MQRTWIEFLRGAPSGGHAVQIYRDESELAESVASYLAAGFRDGDPALVVACPEHRTSFAAALATRNWDIAELEAQGLLTVADAGATLAAFMSGGRPSPVSFEEMMGGVLDSISERHPDRRIRIFGEMVDLLCLRGENEAALALEELWNRLARKRQFSLLCGYRLDVFDRASQTTTLPGVCRSHTHVLPAFDSTRLTVAVDRALGEILGPAEVGKVYLLVAEEARRERISVAQLALMWISANMPVTADRILASARVHYERLAPSPGV